eukprot:TRINITY_DN4170_c0_g2_i1.p1 TRINITY_DN4170_c0_g2~~TRINITY_DN4170_c0_g2_i1.p1  ORF type:complete len:118 (-),score=28.28 TRINITY_DN4170_c0_g2_i1:109-462(-)
MMVLKKLMERVTSADIDEARDGVEACNKALENHYDLILMDVQMPVMGGMEATQKIRTFAPMIPIIGVTASATMIDREKCLSVGMNDVLTKPFSNEQFRNCLAKWSPAALKENSDKKV